MMDALKAFDCEEIELMFNGEIRPIILKNPDSNDLIELIVPIRIGWLILFFSKNLIFSTKFNKFRKKIVYKKGNLVFFWKIRYRGGEVCWIVMK